jgi:hypothetical protein
MTSGAKAIQTWDWLAVNDKCQWSWTAHQWSQKSWQRMKSLAQHEGISHIHFETVQSTFQSTDKPWNCRLESTIFIIAIKLKA